jgi:GNAT superfamily N-acetyltransferase
MPRRILGFYALSACEVDTSGLPTDISKRLPHRAGAVRLGRLAVEVSAQGQGLGELLLMDAIRRTCAVREQVGVFALFVDAKDDAAAAFYSRYGFAPLPDSPRTLVLPLGRICSELRATRHAKS